MCVQVLDAGVSLAGITFGAGDGYLRTEIGRIKLADETAAVKTVIAETDVSETEAPGPLKWEHDYALSADRCWMCEMVCHEWFGFSICCLVAWLYRIGMSLHSGVDISCPVVSHTPQFHFSRTAT